VNCSDGVKMRAKCGWLVIVALLTVSGCAGWFAEPDPNLGSQDAAILTEIKTALIKDTELNAAPVKVEVTKGVVQLTGFVETKARKRRASVVAESISGVTGVNNEIVVK